MLQVDAGVGTKIPSRVMDGLLVKDQEGPLDKTLETKNIPTDYEVPGWPPEVSRNVSNYIDFDSKNTFIMGPNLRPFSTEGE